MGWGFPQQEILNQELDTVRLAGGMVLHVEVDKLRVGEPFLGPDEVWIPASFLGTAELLADLAP